MYQYFCIHTDCYSNTWETKDVEEFIESKKLFYLTGNGSYKGSDFFCDIQLLLVNNWDLWSSNNYDSIETNYISIVVGDTLSDKCDEFLKELSVFLGWGILQDI